MLRFMDRANANRVSAITHRRPTLEALEERTVPSATNAAAPALGPALMSGFLNQSHASVLPLSITGVTVQNGQLVAQGLLGSTAFSAPLTLSGTSSSPASAADPAPATQVLNLHIDAIHLNLLGLNVDTSPICVDIQAQPGPGNLLGNLVSDVAGLLNGGTSLSTILSGLTGDQLTTLTGGLTSVLNGLAGRLTSPSSVAKPAASTPGVTNILNLSVGPVNLNLLGLEVTADNCSGGPITVDVTAQSGPGNLLGNLLTDVAGALDQTHLSTRAIDHVLTRVADAVLMTV